MTKMGKTSHRHCVFVSSKFAALFPNFDRYFREGITPDSIIFDCLSVHDLGRYLHIVASHQEIDFVRDADLWIPTDMVLCVLMNYDKNQLGFSPQKQIENTPVEDVQEP